MGKSVSMDTTERQYEGLHRALDRLRSNSRTVVVDAEALRSLLRDHGRLLALHRGNVSIVGEDRG